MHYLPRSPLERRCAEVPARPVVHRLPYRSCAVEGQSLPNRHFQLRILPYAQAARDAAFRVHRPLDPRVIRESARGTTVMRRFILLGLMGFSLIQAQAPPLTPEAEEFIGSHFQEARSAEALQLFPKAIEEYELIVKRYPNAVPEVYQNLGLVYFLV